MGIETVGINIGKKEILTPYLISWYDGERQKSFSYFIPDGDVKGTVLRIMKDICIRKYKGYKIYMHNFSKFDAMFLIKYLVSIGNCKPVIHKSKIISFGFSPKWYKKLTVTFYDSYLLLTSSLRNLCKSFSVDNPKSIFPFRLNDINYEGEVPDFSLFDKIPLEEYESYKNSFIGKIWSFKDEAIRYCALDCVSLYQVLNKFNRLIFDKFNLNITDYPTLPSLAFSIFRSSYNKEENIHQLSGKIDKEIRSGNTGGSTDMFIPKNPIGVKIHVYDVNSLYPFVMMKFKYPIGSPIYFEGNILLTYPKAFGFFYCKIEAPMGLKHPILQLHHRTGGGIRTIAPLGKWEGWYFSEELFNAIKFGYKIEIVRGYLFKKGEIFKDYVSDLYNIRLNYPKTDPMNLTAKLLLNSLYGRFGMNDQFNEIEILNQEDFDDLTQSKYADISEIIEIPTKLMSGNKYIVSYFDPRDAVKTKIDGNWETPNINIAIASAVTAYARIHMSQFKNNPLLPNLYYTDTDSAYFDGPIPDKYISSTELGKLKLEGIYDKALFLAPKVYALKNDSEEIIKIKGLSKQSIQDNNINLEILESLLNKDYKMSINQSKWFRSVSEANIKILEQTYELKVTGNKRELVYVDGKLSSTKPLVI